jgi:hypothetical protein
MFNGVGKCLLSNPVKMPGHGVVFDGVTNPSQRNLQLIWKSFVELSASSCNAAIRLFDPSATGKTARNTSSLFAMAPRRRAAGRSELGVTLAAAEDLPEPFVDQAITLAALRAGQQQAAVIGFNGGHGLVNSTLNRHHDPFPGDLNR